MDNRPRLFSSQIPRSQSSQSNDRQTPSPACNLRRRRRRRASRRRAVGASETGAERPGDLSCRRQGRRGDGRGRGAALPRRTWPCAVALSGHRNHSPRPWRADTADQGDRSRSSGARRGRTERRGREFAAGAGRRCRRSPAGAVVGRRLRELDRAGCRRVVRAEAAGDAGVAALGRPDRRDQYRSQASVADQGRPARARRPTRRDRDAGDLGRSTRRPFGDRLRTDGAGPHHACGCARHRCEIWP